MIVMDRIWKKVLNTIFADVGADIKGNYESIVISTKKKYKGVN